MSKERLANTGYYVGDTDCGKPEKGEIHGVQYVNKEIGKAVYCHSLWGKEQKKWCTLIWTCAVTQKQVDTTDAFEYYATHEELLASGHTFHPITHQKPTLDP